MVSQRAIESDGVYKITTIRPMSAAAPSPKILLDKVDGSRPDCTPTKNGDKRTKAARRPWVIPQNISVCYDYGGQLRDAIKAASWNPDKQKRKNRRFRVPAKYADLLQTELPLPLCSKANVERACSCTEFTHFVHYDHTNQVQQVYVNIIMWGGKTYGDRFLQSLMVERSIEGRTEVTCQVPVFFPRINKCRVFGLCRPTFLNLFGLSSSSKGRRQRKSKEHEDPLFRFHYDDEDPTQNAYFIGDVKFKIDESSEAPWAANVAAWKEFVATTKNQRSRRVPDKYLEDTSMVPKSEALSNSG